MFERFAKNTKSKTKIFLGSPEAEAEAIGQARMPLSEVYEDFHNLFDELSAEKFIVVGRKGSGKSAFGEYLQLKSVEDPTLHTKFIRGSEANLERVVQIGQQSGVSIEADSLFKWIIYTHILRLFCNLEIAKDNSEYKNLSYFLSKNSGYIDISSLEIKGLIEKYGFDVSVEYFKRFLMARFNKQIEIKSERAPYFKILPHLEETIIRILTSPEVVENNNTFALFFDDLDVDFKISDASSVKNIISLIRACKYINNDVFGKNNITSKAILFIRDDVERFLTTRNVETDTAKVFASYATRINWYQEEFAGDASKEDDLNLKRFINNRIVYAFEKNGIPVDKINPWSSLVAYSSSYEKTSFKFVVNQTLFRPRDLLLFFLPLDVNKYSIPLSYHDVGILVENYSLELAKEVKSELSAFFDDPTIEDIFKALGKMTRYFSSYNQAIDIIKDTVKMDRSEEILNYLFEMSIIGSINNQGWYTFKCRENDRKRKVILDLSDKIVVQYGMQNYLRRNDYV